VPYWSEELRPLTPVEIRNALDEGKDLGMHLRGPYAPLMMSAVYGVALIVGILFVTWIVRRIRARSSASPPTD
jgi:hypothetical protein